MLYYYYPDFRQINPYYPYGTAGAGMPEPEPTAAQVPFGAPAVTAPSMMLPTAPGAGAAAIPGEESYIENILRFNRGKIGTFYLTFENNPQWNAKVLRGRIETAGRDHIIISDPQTGKRYLLLMVNLDYVEFDEPLNYIPPTLPPYIQQQLTSGTRD